LVTEWNRRLDETVRKVERHRERKACRPPPASLPLRRKPAAQEPFSPQQVVVKALTHVKPTQREQRLVKKLTEALRPETESSGVTTPEREMALAIDVLRHHEPPPRMLELARELDAALVLRARKNQPN
jgi:hypothetical protein